VSRDLCVFYVGRPGSRLAWIKILALDRVGVIADIAEVMAKHGIDQIFGYFEILKRHVRGKYVTFVEICDGSLEDFVRELRGSEDILDVEYEETPGSIVIQTAEFPLQMLGERAMISRTATFVDVLRTIESVYPGRADAVMFHSGLRGGSDAARYFIETSGARGRDFITLLEGILFAAGWGRVKVDFDFEKGRGSIIVRDCFIVDPAGQRSIEPPSCSYLSGYFAGFFSTALGKNVLVREVKCAANGEDYCEHAVQVAPPSTPVEHQV